MYFISSLLILVCSVVVRGQKSSYYATQTQLEAQEAADNSLLARQDYQYSNQYQGFEEEHIYPGYNPNDFYSEQYDNYNVRQDETGLTGTGNRDPLGKLEDLTGLDFGSFLAIFIAASFGIFFMPAIIETSTLVWQKKIDFFLRTTYGILYPNGRSFDENSLEDFLDGIQTKFKTWIEDDFSNYKF